MKRLILSWLILLASSLPALAKTMYTSDITEISVREGKGISFPIITTLRSGQSVKVLESSLGWSKVQLPDGKQGWLVSSYLTDQKPPDLEGPQLKKKIDEVTQQLQIELDKNESLRKENQSLKSQLDDNMKNLPEQDINDSINALESEAYLSLKTNYDQISAKLNEKTKQIEQLQQQANETKKTTSFNKSYLYFFLAGAGVLIIGMLIGASSKRRRSSLL